METHTVIYTVKISFEQGNGKLAELYIDQFMENLPDFIEGLMNENEKVKITLDKNNKKV